MKKLDGLINYVQTVGLKLEEFLLQQTQDGIGIVVLSMYLLSMLFMGLIFVAFLLLGATFNSLGWMLRLLKQGYKATMSILSGEVRN